MAWRSLLKNKVSSLVNIGGLAMGLATSILILMVVLDEFSYDRFHKNLPDIYLLMKNQKQSGDISSGSATAGPMADALRNEMPEVKWAARVGYSQPLQIRIGDKTVYESGLYIEPDLFHIMSFPAIKGDPVLALGKNNSLVITERTAKKWFGSENPIGKIVLIDNLRNISIGAVLQDLPPNSTMQFDMAIPFSIYESANSWLNKWDDNRIQTWIQLKPHADSSVLNGKLTKLLQRKSDDNTVSLFVYPLSKKRLYGGFRNGQPSGGKITVLMMVAIIGLFILLVACINFMNMATASAENRAREVGVRKVLGASRKKIIFQFLSEALLITFISLIIGTILGILVLPLFNRLIHANVRFDFGNWRIWTALIGTGLFTGLVAGIYPAFFLSRFKTAKVLKGIKTAGKSSGILRKTLVTIQFMISIFFIVGTIVVYAEINHIKNRPIGYDQENLIDVHANGPMASKFDLFKNELSKLPGVKSLSAGSENLLEYGGAVTGMDWTGKTAGDEISIIVSDVQYNWIHTSGLTLLEGRDFSPLYGADTSSCLVNETTVEKLKLKKQVSGSKLGGKEIIGVFKNFVFNNPSGIIAPMAVYLNTHELRHFLVRIQNDGHWRETLAQIEQISKKINPDFAFEFNFLRETYQQRFEEFNDDSFMINLFGSIAIFISCLGLFGLSAFVAAKRSREMSIRKVFGASVTSVGLLLSKDFLKPVFIAFLIVTPLAVWSLHTWLADIPYHIELSWWMFALAGFLSMLIALLTVSYQGIRTALENPVDNLRNE